MNQLEEGGGDDSPPRISRWQQMFGQPKHCAIKQADVALGFEFKYTPDLVEPHQYDSEDDDEEDADPVAKCLNDLQRKREHMLSQVMDGDFVHSDSVEQYSRAESKSEANVDATLGSKRALQCWHTVEEQAKAIRLRSTRVNSQRPDRKDQKMLSVVVDDSVDPRLVMQVRHEKVAQKRHERRERNKQRDEDGKAKLQQKQPRVRRVKLDCGNNNNIINNNNNNNKDDAEPIRSRDLEAEARAKVREECRARSQARDEEAHQMRKRLEIERLTQTRRIREVMEARDKRRKAQTLRWWKISHAIRMHERRRQNEDAKLVSCVWTSWQAQVCKTRDRRHEADLRHRSKLCGLLFRDWKAFVTRMLTERNDAQVTQQLKRQKLHQQMAEAFDARRVLRAKFLKWMLWIDMSRDERRHRQKRDERQLKVRQLLANAAERKAKRDKNEEVEVEVKQHETLNTYQQRQGRQVRQDLEHHCEAEGGKTSTCELRTREKTTAQRIGEAATSTSLKTTSKIRQSSETSKKTRVAPPASVLSMEQRLRERREGREALKQKYQELEQQRQHERVKHEEEEENRRLREKDELKRRKIEEKREKKQKELQIQLRREAYVEQTRLARIHYSRAVVTRYGWKPWLNLMDILRLKWKKAARWHADTLRAHALNCWKKCVAAWKHRKAIEAERYMRQIDMWHLKSVRRRYFALWTLVQQSYARQVERATRLHREHVLNRVMTGWKAVYHEQFLRNRSRARKARAQLEQKQKQRIWSGWCKAVDDLKLQSELERDKEEAWAEVREWLNEIH